MRREAPPERTAPTTSPPGAGASSSAPAGGTGSTGGLEGGRQKRGKAGSAPLEVEQAARSGWLKVLAPGNESLLRLLKRSLDDGEAEAIALALERKPDVILLDESAARRVADVYALRKTGVIGLLVRARLEGKLSSLSQELERLRQDAGFWISEELYRLALEAAGEG